LQANAQLDSIAWLAGLVGGQITCSGNLALKVAGSGSIGAPVFSGDVTGDGLALRWINEGLVLRNGALRAQWNGPNLQIQDLHFDGVQAQGVLRFADAQTSLRLTTKADQLTLLSRPDRLLVVSGQTEFAFDSTGLRLSGNVKADRAKLELVAQDTPALSDDIRLFRNQRLQEKANPTLPLRVDLTLDLGDQFQVRGQGLDVRLAGKLHWQALDRRGPRLIGEVQAVEGTYTAYGKKLKLERSSINFSGAWDNPGLNIRAFRQRTDSRLDSNTEPEVGVELSGTLLAPQAKLVSTPALPDSEKLAYLVLGRGLEGANGQQELDILSAASAALFGQADGGFANKITDNLTNKLGLDDLGVSFAKGVDNAVLTVGKRLSKRAYLSFEQGVGSASGLVKLRYAFNSRLSVQVQSGSNNAVDVFYSFRFD
jgi:translocation and assembly module TamB